MKLQTYRGGDSLADVMAFYEEDGLIVTDTGGRHRGFADWREWIGKRAQAGKPAQKGFPRSGRFNG